jgi:hypothetical protein
MIVVFDSNIWLSELGLRSGAGAAVRFYLKHSGARVAIPEVVRLEVQHNLKARLTKYIESIRSDYNQLLTAFGTLREIVLPTEQEVEARIADLFASLDVETLDVPFTLESARNSFLKTIYKSPASHSSQQFKDGVLWADCLALLRKDSVILVTADKGFYEGGQYSQGLAWSLKDEASVCGGKIQVLPAVADLLRSVSVPISTDGDALQQAFLATHSESINGMLERNGFTIGPRVEMSSNLFATDNPNVLFIDFRIVLHCDDVRGEARTEATLTLKGDGSYLPASREFRNLRNFGEELQFRLPDGSKKEMRNIVLFVDGITSFHFDQVPSCRQ